MPKKSTAPVPKFTPSHPSAPWRVYHQGKSIWFKDELDAQKKCDEIGKGRAAKLSAREIDELLYAKELLGGTPLLHAVRFFVQRHPSVTRSTTVADAVKTHVATYEKARPDYYDRKKLLLKKLTDRFGDHLFSAITADNIETLLNAESSDWVRNDLLTHTRTLFRNAKKKRLILEDPTEAFTFLNPKPSKVILTVEDAAHVLTVAADQFPELLPAVALQLFSGVRTSEIMRLDWADIRHGKFINIEPHVAKTHERRVIDWWPPALTKWMPEAKKSGSIIPHPKNYEHKKWRLLAVCKGTKADFKFGQNAFRHSFCSYACAHFENAGKATLLAGQHDVNIFFRHYRSYRTPEEARKYFGLTQEAGLALSEGE